MKKIIRSCLITLIVFGSMTSILAYGRSSSCELAWYAGFARSGEVGISKGANFSATSYSSSISIMRLEAWARWEDPIFPWMRQSYVNVAPGRSESYYEPMSKRSLLRVELRPNDNTYRANGKGYVSL